MSTREIATARMNAAEAVDVTLAAVGPAVRRLTALTEELGARLQVDLAPRLEVPITLCLMQAGLAEFLARKLQGAPPALAGVVEHQHEGLEARIARSAGVPGHPIL